MIPSDKYFITKKNDCFVFPLFFFISPLPLTYILIYKEGRYN